MTHSCLTLVAPSVHCILVASSCVHVQGLKNEYYHDGERFNMRAFWADHKPILPNHYGVYVAEVGCLKAAAANVETVFSGSGMPLP